MCEEIYIYYFSMMMFNHSQICIGKFCLYIIQIELDFKTKGFILPKPDPGISSHFPGM